MSEPVQAHQVKKAQVSQLDEIVGVPCPCGISRRAFSEAGGPATVHLVDIKTDSERHYHRKTTEIYVVLEGEGILEYDDEIIPLRPMTSVMIPPGVVHRARGSLRLLNIPIPAFDEHDEFVVPENTKQR